MSQKLMIEGWAIKKSMLGRYANGSAPPWNPKPGLWNKDLGKQHYKYKSKWKKKACFIECRENQTKQLVANSRRLASSVNKLAQ